MIDSRLRASDNLEQDHFANQFDTSRNDLSENQPKYTAAPNLEDSTRKQRLIERLRSGSEPSVENRIKLNSRQALQANVEEKTYQQQPISDGFGYKKPLATGNELSTTKTNIELLAHRQRLLNQLRSKSLTTKN